MSTYLLVSLAAGADPAATQFSVLRAKALAAGLSVSDLSSRTWLGVAGPTRPGMLGVGAWTLVGDVFNRRDAPVRRVPDDDPLVYEKKLIARFWGRFVGLRLDGDGVLAALLRDPSGALDCVHWSNGPLRFAASDVPEWLIRILKPDWRIDADRVEAALHDPYASEAALLLAGPEALAPGSLHSFADGMTRPVWRPDWIARHAPRVTHEDAAQSLRDAVDEAVAGFSRSGGVLAAEISGGLDSSIIAATLRRNPNAEVRLWLNAWGPDASADERPWVDALAAHLGIAATSNPRATGKVTRDLLESVPQGFRPGLAGLDGLHDADWASRLKAAGVDRILTGKGGDGLFIQPADLGVYVDLWRQRGWKALASPALVDLARWNERSVWSLIANARRGDWRPEPTSAPTTFLNPRQFAASPHPWLGHAGDLGPAKRLQILGLVQGVGFHGPSLQTQVAEVIHPLLAQPVVEACLALPTPQLTLGRRDRGLARHAFLDRLPPVITTRRSKGEMTAFYGRMIADGLDVMRPWLLDGRLASMGLIDRSKAESLLTRESLAWRGGYVDIMVAATIEGWVRAWERRLSVR